MVYVTNGKYWVWREGDTNEILNATGDFRSSELLSGLGIDGFELPPPPQSLDNGSFRSLRRRMSVRRPAFLFRTRSGDSTPDGKDSVSRASGSASPASQMATPEPERVSPTLWRTSNPSVMSLMSAANVEDLSTYQSNLARYRTERAQREAELGLRNLDSVRPESFIIDRPVVREESVRRSPRAGLGRGLRTYWGGGSSLEHRSSQDSDISRASDLYWDEKNDKEALKAWWDNLGSDTMATIAEGRA